MEPTTAEQMAAWMDATQVQGFKHRDWPRVQKLAAVCVALMVAGLLTELWLTSTELAVLGYIGAGVFSGVMLAYYLDERLFVEKPPTR